MSQLRRATLDDVPELARLIAWSARELGRTDYTSEQIEAALGSAWGVDTQLIRDGTSFAIIERGQIIACGGWSKRKALFGADALSSTEPQLLNPQTDAARIRAFFVHPQWSRRGLGSLLLDQCESEARRSSFQCAELVATLPGERLYQRFGYRSLAAYEYPLRQGLTITFVPMRKDRL
jgi:N-acetylglutamate synthase-like GNAT family acetyltransferase